MIAEIQTPGAMTDQWVDGVEPPPAAQSAPTEGMKPEAATLPPGATGQASTGAVLPQVLRSMARCNGCSLFVSVFVSVATAAFVKQTGA